GLTRQTMNMNERKVRSPVEPKETLQRTPLMDLDNPKMSVVIRRCFGWQATLSETVCNDRRRRLGPPMVLCPGPRLGSDLELVDAPWALRKTTGNQRPSQTFSPMKMKKI